MKDNQTSQPEPLYYVTHEGEVRPFCEQIKAMGWQWIECDIFSLSAFRTRNTTGI